MAYDENLETRLTQLLTKRSIPFEAKKMMGGLAIMINGKMCIGIIKDQLMARVGPDAYQQALQKPGCHPMDFTKRPMKGYVYVSQDVLQSEKDLAQWLDLCLAFNPEAKASSKKAKRR